MPADNIVYGYKTVEKPRPLLLDTKVVWVFKVCLFLPDIKFRIKSVEVLGIQMFFDDVQPFTEMSNLRKWLERFIYKGLECFHQSGGVAGFYGKYMVYRIKDSFDSGFNLFQMGYRLNSLVYLMHFRFHLRNNRLFLIPCHIPSYIPF